MALIDCPECQGKVSSLAVACPQCGFPVKEYFLNLGKLKKENALKELFKNNTSLQKIVNGANIMLGSYKGAPMWWTVKERIGDFAYLLNVGCLDFKAYNTRKSEADWNRSTIREWLNDEFLKNSFSEEEMSLICKIKTVDKHASGFVVGSRCVDDNDMILLPSEAEAKRYGITLVPVTKYALENCPNTGKLYSSQYNRNNNVRYTRVWLRTDNDYYTSKSSTRAMVTEPNGVDTFGEGVYSNYIGICPCMWIKVPNITVEKD